MDCVTILAQAVETASSGAAEEAVVPMESFWNYITTLNRVEAVTFISFGVVCLMYGWRVFKILVVISFALLGLFLGISITDKIVGLKQVKAIHLNDSKKDLGSRVDRHEHIGRGKIGLEGFRLLLNDPRFAAVPMYLETPKEDADGTPNGAKLDKMNLKTLRSLVKS